MPKPGDYWDPLGGVQLARQIREYVHSGWENAQIVEAIFELVQGHQQAMAREPELRADFEKHPWLCSASYRNCEQLLVCVVLGRQPRCGGCGHRLVAGAGGDASNRCTSAGHVAPVAHCSKTGQPWPHRGL